MLRFFLIPPSFIIPRFSSSSSSGVSLLPRSALFCSVLAPAGLGFDLDVVVIEAVDAFMKPVGFDDGADKGLYLLLSTS
jgi:hypothetical protein